MSASANYAVINLWRISQADFFYAAERLGVWGGGLKKGGKKEKAYRFHSHTANRATQAQVQLSMQIWQLFGVNHQRGLMINAGFTIAHLHVIMTTHAHTTPLFVGVYTPRPVVPGVSSPPFVSSSYFFPPKRVALKFCFSDFIFSPPCQICVCGHFFFFFLCLPFFSLP